MDNKWNMDGLKTRLDLPAYDNYKNGILITLSLDIIPSSNLKIHANGSVAASLKKMMERAIFILSNLKQSWGALKFFQYNLNSSIGDNFRVMDARSAGLPLCIALMNILRQINGLEQVSHFIGTGILRIDGSFDKSSLEERKQRAVQQIIDHRKMFVDSFACQHVFDLATLMSCSKP